MDLSNLSARERAFVEGIEDAERREVVACSLLAHRQPDKLAEGDKVPDLQLEPLFGGAPVRLRDDAGGRPLVLIFGSYT